MHPSGGKLERGSKGHIAGLPTIPQEDELESKQVLQRFEGSQTKNVFIWTKSFQQFVLFYWLRKELVCQ